VKSQPLREDKHCLNCGNEVPERYCSHCGQENTVQHETFSHLVKHFVADLFHYDSQFLKTLKLLLFRPGFLTREYMAGKRVKYVNPIKLYVFVSFVFFFMVFGVLMHHSEGGEGTSHTSKKHKKEAKAKHKASADSVYQYNDSAALAAANAPISIDSALINDLSYRYKGAEKTDSESATRELATGIIASVSDREDTNNTQTLEERYEAQQASLDPERRDGKFNSKISRSMLRVLDRNKDYNGHVNVNELMAEFFKHNAPKIMFILMPLFALLMKWLYIRRKKFLYADHAIFSLHFHSFAFMLFLFAAILLWFFPSIPAYSISFWGLFAYLTFGLFNNYGQSFLKSLFKSALLTIMYFFCIVTVMMMAIIVVAVFY
jgi:hypothetical protein